MEVFVKHDWVNVKKNSTRTMYDLRDAFQEALKLVTVPGSFACGESASLPLPVLRIEGIHDVISWPIPASQAQQIIDVAAERAPHGRGTETVVDTKVRDAYRVMPERIKFDNPDWD